MSIRTGSRPRRQLYWPKAGSGQWLILRHWLLEPLARSRRRCNDFAGFASRQRSPAHDLALHRHAVYAQYAVFAYAKRAAYAYAKRAAHALAGLAAFTLRWFSAFESQAVTGGLLALYIGIGGVAPPPASQSILIRHSKL